MENKNLINIVVMTQQAKTYLYNNVDKDSIKLINTMLIFKHKGTITDSWNDVTFFNAAGYSILNKDAKLVGPNQPKEESKPQEPSSKQEKLLKFLKENGFYNEETNTYTISIEDNPVDFGNSNVFFSRIKTKGSLYQYNQKVEGNLYQDHQEVKGDIEQDWHQVDGDLWQFNQKVKGKIYQKEEEGNKDGK